MDWRRVSDLDRSECTTIPPAHKRRPVAGGYKPALPPLEQPEPADSQPEDPVEQGVRLDRSAPDYIRDVALGVDTSQAAALPEDTIRSSA